jgi:microcystin-dependent protein
MSSPFIGEIRIFAGSFAPAGWATCDGQLMPISENDALFTLIGTTYGGDGQSTFGLPNLSARVPVHQGQGPGITQNYVIGEAGGVDNVTLTTQQMPSHNHQLVCSTSIATLQTPQNAVLAQSTLAKMYFADATDSNLAPATIGMTGGSQPHDNMQPYLALTYIISLFGIFPTQS